MGSIRAIRIGNVEQLLLRIVGSLGQALRHTPLVRWRWLGRLYDRFTMKLGKTDAVTVGPFTVFLDPRDHVIAKKLILYGNFEGREIELLCSHVRPGDCALDVGANIGLYSLALSRAVGPTGHVIAVEPDPENLALLRRNLQFNGCTNVIVIVEALGDEAGTVMLYETDRDNRGALSTVDIAGVGAQRALEVKMRRGDSVMQEVGLKPRIAKIDVEGTEPRVFAGLGAFLPEVLLFEFVPHQLRAAGHDPVSFLHTLDAAGYTLALVDPDTGDHPILTEETIYERVAAARTDRNVLAISRDRFPNLSSSDLTNRAAAQLHQLSVAFSDLGRPSASSHDTAIRCV